jgi:hypothetical protein
MKLTRPGNPSCRRISHENTIATSPIPIAVIGVLDRDHLRILAPDVFANEGLRVIELDLTDLRRRCEF